MNEDSRYDQSAEPGAIYDGKECVPVTGSQIMTEGKVELNLIKER